MVTKSSVHPPGDAFGNRSRTACAVISSPRMTNGRRICPRGPPSLTKMSSRVKRGTRIVESFGGTQHGSTDADTAGQEARSNRLGLEVVAGPLVSSEAAHPRGRVRTLVAQRTSGWHGFRSCLDILDGTPLWDIKPYVSQYDSYPDQRCGWLDEGRARLRTATADGRFEISPLHATT
jgi:hypothetical protein